jgi:hypothetical protein
MSSSSALGWILITVVLGLAACGDDDYGRDLGTDLGVQADLSQLD